jgi:hypothetical protein
LRFIGTFGEWREFGLMKRRGVTESRPRDEYVEWAYGGRQCWWMVTTNDIQHGYSIESEGMKSTSLGRPLHGFLLSPQCFWKFRAADS